MQKVRIPTKFLNARMKKKNLREDVSEDMMNTVDQDAVNLLNSHESSNVAAT